MIPHNADDDDVIAEAIRYQLARRDRGDLMLPKIYVPLGWRIHKDEPDTAEVDMTGRRPRVVRRFQQPRPR